MKKGSDVRRAGHAIHTLLLDRWSSRAMSGEPLTDQELMGLFEAARWAPSGSNMQPWRFVYARRDTPHFATFADFLVPANRVWAQHAGALIVVISDTLNRHNNAPSRSHSFDTGAAWQNLALQGWHTGLVIHGMGGFDASMAKAALKVPDDYAVEMMIAVGKPGNPADLGEALQARETPNDRKPLAELVREGVFGF